MRGKCTSKANTFGFGSSFFTSSSSSLSVSSPSSVLSVFLWAANCRKDQCLLRAFSASPSLSAVPAAQRNIRVVEKNAYSLVRSLWSGIGSVHITQQYWLTILNSQHSGSKRSLPTANRQAPSASLLSHFHHRPNSPTSNHFTNEQAYELEPTLLTIYKSTYKQPASERMRVQSGTSHIAFYTLSLRLVIVIWCLLEHKIIAWIPHYDQLACGGLDDALGSSSSSSLSSSPQLQHKQMITAWIH